MAFPDGGGGQFNGYTEGPSGIDGSEIILTFLKSNPNITYYVQLTVTDFLANTSEAVFISYNTINPEPNIYVDTSLQASFESTNDANNLLVVKVPESTERKCFVGQ